MASNLVRRRVSLALGNPSRLASTSTQPPPLSSSRWLADVKARLGKCIFFGIKGQNELADAQRICQALGSEWKGLVIGNEGFIVDQVPGGRAEDVGCRSEELGHVNNIEYLKYAETSRVHYLRRLAVYVSKEHLSEWNQIATPRGVGVILKRATVDFLFPLSFPDHLTLAHCLHPTFDPESNSDEPVSLQFRCAVLSHRHQRVASRILEDVPIYDYRQGRRTGLPPWMREAFIKAKANEDRSRQVWEERRTEVEGWLQSLESRTVNSGREEDVGKKD